MSGYIYCLVQRAEDVLVADARGTSDCFVRAFMEGHMKNAKETSVIPKSLNPVWDTVLSIPRPKAGQEAQTLMLEVFDHDWNGKDLLGFATVDVSSLKDGEMREEILDLQWREGVKLTYSSERPSSRGLGRLYVRVGTGEDKNPSKELLKAVEVCSTAELTKARTRPANPPSWLLVCSAPPCLSSLARLPPLLAGGAST